MKPPFADPKMADSRYRTKYYRGNQSGNLPNADTDEWQEDDGGQAGFGGRGGGRGGQRHNDQESGGGNSYRPRSNYSDRASGDAVTMTVASSDVGRIIGKGGKTIRELEENSRARIKILEGQGDRTIEISGSEDAKATAQDMINKILEANQNRGFGFRDSGSSGNYRGNGAGRGSYGDGGDRRSARGDDVTISVASSDIGRIIGKGGMKIRELQDSSGARIKILDDTGSGDRQVLISGSDESKAVAQELIKELTDASQNRGSRYDGGANAGAKGFSKRQRTN